MSIIDDKFIIEYFYMKSSPNKINSHKLRNIPNDIQQYIDNRFSDSLSLKETLMRIRYGIEKHPLCPICNKPVMFFGHSKDDMFHNTCCIEHRNIYRTQCIKNAVNAKYGVDNVFLIESTKEKIKRINLERYGVTCCLQNKDILEKSKLTCLSKYGVTNAGGINTSLLKALNTCLNRYGVTHYSKTEEFKKWNSDHMLQKEVLQRIYATRKKNNTFNSSKYEDKLYNLLINKFGEHNIIRQYKSTDYPYNCDFYVKPLNLYIEYLGSWLHGFHPYNHNDKKDLERVSKLKEKSNNGKNMYEHAITVWTEIDVKKRETAKKNNLNYLEIFWNENLNDIVNNL